MRLAQISGSVCSVILQVKTPFIAAQNTICGKGGLIREFIAFVCRDVGSECNDLRNPGFCEKFIFSQNSSFCQLLDIS